MLRLRSDLENKVLTDIIDNRRNLITAGVLRLILQDIVDTVLEPPRYLHFNDVTSFLTFLDNEYQAIIDDIQRDPGFREAFKVRPYGIVIDIDLGITSESQSPQGHDVIIEHNSYSERGSSIYLVNNQTTGSWILLYEVNRRVAYNNTTPMYTTVGGLEEGKVFNYEPIEELLTGLLYPYQPPILELTGTVSSQLREVGLPLIDAGESFLFNLEVTHADNVDGILTLKYNGESLGTIFPGQSFSYAPSNYTELPVVSSVPGVYSWTIEGVDTRGDVCIGKIEVDWRHKIIIGWATSKVSDPMDLSPIDELLYKPESIVKPATEVPGYLHIFLPTSYAAFDKMTVAGIDVVFEPIVEVTLVRLGAEVTYRRYAATYPTYSEFTLLFS